MTRSLLGLWMSALSFLAWPVSARADWHLIELREASINYKNFISAREPLFELSPPKNEINLFLNANFLKYFFWDNKVHAVTDETQFRLIGWNFFLGVHICRYLDVQYEHYSRHLMDLQPPGYRFPYEDSIGIRLYLLRSDIPHQELF